MNHFLPLTASNLSVNAPVGQTNKHSPQDLHKSGSTTVTFASQPCPTMSIALFPVISRQAVIHLRHITHLSVHCLIKGVAYSNTPLSGSCS